MSYCAYVTRIKAVTKHPNADRLQVGEVFGNHVIVGLDVKEGDLGLYFPTDGRLGLEFAKKNNLLRKDENGNPMGGYLDYDKRHITSIRLRGEQSDGLFASLDTLSSFCDISKLKDGEQITTLNGVLICEKYFPKPKQTNATTTSKSKKKSLTESYPLFEQHIDTSQLAYNTSKFKEGDTCYITLKLHGTSQRTAHTIKKSNISSFKKVLNKIGFKFKPKKTWEYISGTRRVTLSNFEGGYYGGNAFRKQWHDSFEGKLHKGEEVFYEVVGYIQQDQLIMPECDNKKTNDKAFIKQYGEKTRFTYGCGTGQNDIYVYRMTKTDEDGFVTEYPTELVQLRCEQMGVKFVPILDKFLFTSIEDLMERVKRFEDGADPVGNTHVREGIIVRTDNKEKFTAYKHKNFNFKVLEGIVKSSDVLDIEESESLGENND